MSGGWLETPNRSRSTRGSSSGNAMAAAAGTAPRRRISTSTRRELRGATSASSGGPYDLDQVQIEHVYPQHPQRGYEDPTLGELVHDLGNLAFWQGDENRLASNKPYLGEDTDNSKKPDLLG